MVADAASAATRAAWASSIAQRGRPSARRPAARAPPSAPRPRRTAARSRSPPAIRLPTVYSSGPSPGRTSRPETPVVDRQDADRPALRHERRAEERGDLQQPRRTPGCARPGPGRRRGTAAARPPGASWTSCDDARRRAAARAPRPARGHLGAAADRSAVAQDAARPRRPAGRAPGRSAGGASRAASERSSSSSRSSVEPAATAELVERHQLGDVARWRSRLARSDRAVGLPRSGACCAAQRRAARRRAAPPYSTRPAGQERGQHDRDRLASPGPRAIEVDEDRDRAERCRGRSARRSMAGPTVGRSAAASASWSAGRPRGRRPGRRSAPRATRSRRAPCRSEAWNSTGSREIVPITPIRSPRTRSGAATTDANAAFRRRSPGDRPRRR